MNNKFLELMAGLTTLRDGDIASLVKGSLTTLSSLEPKVSTKEGAKTTGPTIDSVIDSAIAAGMNRLKIPYIPNCNMFTLKISGYNPLLAAAGLQTRMGSNKAMFTYRNARVNRYLKYMTARMINLRGSGQEAYWKVAIHFIRHSNSYLIANLHAINRNFYREKSQSYLLSVMMKVNDLRYRFPQEHIKRHFGTGK
jgi:hypothetical protein